MVRRSQPASASISCGVAERGAHHHGLDAVRLVVGVDAPHRQHAGIGLARVGPAAGLDVPVEDAADEGRDQERAGVGGGRRLDEREQQREVAVDALALQHLGGADALPGRGELDQDALAADAARRVGAR